MTLDPNLIATVAVPGKLWGISWALAAGMVMMDQRRKGLVRRYPGSLPCPYRVVIVPSGTEIEQCLRHKDDRLTETRLVNLK